MALEGPDFSDSRDPIFSYSRDLMITFSDSRDAIFNSRDPNRVPKTPLKKPVLKCKMFETDHVEIPQSCLNRYILFQYFVSILLLFLGQAAVAIAALIFGLQVSYVDNN